MYFVRRRIHQNRKREETPQRLYTNRPRKWIYHLQFPFNPQMPGEMQCFLQHPQIYFSQKERWIMTLMIFLQWGRWYFQWLRWRDGPSTLDPGRTSQRHHKQGHPEVNLPASLHPPRSFYQATISDEVIPKNLMFYPTINLQPAELQNFRKIFYSV